MPTFPGSFPAPDDALSGFDVQNIVNEGLLMAGDTSLGDRALVFLRSWLRQQYDSYPWPFVHRERSGMVLGTGVQTISVGRGSNSIAESIRRVLDPIRIYDSGFNTQANVRIRQLTSDILPFDETLNNPVTNRGLPSVVKVRADTVQWGKWDLVFDRAADKPYLLKMQYLMTPEDPDTDEVPLYPNARTMMKAVEVEALRYKKAENYQAEREVLGRMVVQDRLAYGDVHGTNDMLALDGSVFKGSHGPIR